MKRKVIGELGDIDRVLSLIRTKATGSTEQLAARLGISKRSVERIMSDLRDDGFPIEYCKNNHHYYFAGEVKYEFNVVIYGQDLVNIRGGRNHSICGEDEYPMAQRRWS